MELGFQALGQDCGSVCGSRLDRGNNPSFLEKKKKKKSGMPAANECTVNVGKTTRSQQSEINEVDQHSCFHNV